MQTRQKERLLFGKKHVARAAAACAAASSASGPPSDAGDAAPGPPGQHPSAGRAAAAAAAATFHSISAAIRGVTNPKGDPRVDPRAGSGGRLERPSAPGTPAARSDSGSGLGSPRGSAEGFATLASPRNSEDGGADERVGAAGRRREPNPNPNPLSASRGRPPLARLLSPRGSRDLAAAPHDPHPALTSRDPLLARPAAARRLDMGAQGGAGALDDAGPLEQGLGGFREGTEQQERPASLVESQPAELLASGCGGGRVGAGDACEPDLAPMMSPFARQAEARSHDAAALDTQELGSEPTAGVAGSDNLQRDPDPIPGDAPAASALPSAVVDSGDALPAGRDKDACIAGAGLISTGPGSAGDEAHGGAELGSSSQGTAGIAAAAAAVHAAVGGVWQGSGNPGSMHEGPAAGSWPRQSAEEAPAEGLRDAAPAPAQGLLGPPPGFPSGLPGDAPASASQAGLRLKDVLAPPDQDTRLGMGRHPRGLQQGAQEGVPHGGLRLEDVLASPAPGLGRKESSSGAGSGRDPSRQGSGSSFLQGQGLLSARRSADGGAAAGAGGRHRNQAAPEREAPAEGPNPSPRASRGARARGWPAAAAAEPSGGERLREAAGNAGRQCADLDPAFALIPYSMTSIIRRSLVYSTYFALHTYKAFPCLQGNCKVSST